MRFHISICEIRTKQISDIAVSLMHHYNKIQKYLENKNFLMTDTKQECHHTYVLLKI